MAQAKASVSNILGRGSERPVAHVRHLGHKDVVGLVGHPLRHVVVQVEGDVGGDAQLVALPHVFGVEVADGLHLAPGGRVPQILILVVLALDHGDIAEPGDNLVKMAQKVGGLRGPRRRR